MSELITIVGGAYSNSYVTLPEADLIASNFPWYDDWNTYTDEQKTQALIQAAFAMQQLPWDGDKCTPASDAGKTYERWETYFQPLSAGTLENPADPFRLESIGAASAPTQIPITWGTPGSLMPITVSNSISMAPTSRMSGAIVYDENDNALTGNIESLDPTPFSGKFSYITADYANLGDPNGTEFTSIFIDGVRLVNYTNAPAGASQRLAWPRSGVTCDGEEADCTYIPETIKITQVIIAYNFLKNPSDVPGTPGSGSGAPAGTYVKRQKIDVLEIEYDQFNSNQYNDDCDNCDDPYLIRIYPWLADLLGCWLNNKGRNDNRLIRLFRN